MAEIRLLEASCGNTSNKMSNICENTLRVYSENSENLKYVEAFFKDLGDVERVDDENLEVYFDSKWRFPEGEMNKLYINLPDKSSINMTCLSIEWGCFYCQFHICDKGGWIAED